MFTISAFADEISPDPEEQLTVLERCGIRHVELRSVNQTNVLDLSDAQIDALKSLFAHRGFQVSALASPIGKSPIDQPFAPELQRFRRALERCQVFGTRNLRVFSYYLPEGGDWDNWRRDVMDRMWDQLRLAEKAGVRLLHENEQRIYGDDPERVKDLMETVLEQVPEGSLAAIYDPGNYVLCGYDSWQAWQLTKRWTRHFHIKDWVRGEKHACLAGNGDGRIPDVIADAASAGFDGFATLEPHLLSGGPTGGTTGPELFPAAVKAFQLILDRAGACWQ